MDRVQETFRVLAETQRALVTGREDQDVENYHRFAWDEEYCGVGTAKQYKLWKRLVCLIICFHDLSHSKLALLIAGQVKGIAQGALDILEINVIMGSSSPCQTDWRETR